MWNHQYNPTPKIPSGSDPNNVDYHNLFVKHLPTDLTEGQLKYLFHTFGEIVETKIMINRMTGESLGYGFVRFSDTKESKIAHDVMNGYKIGSKRLYITFAHRIHSHQRNHKATRNLYIAGIPDSYDERKLREMFSKYGDIINVKLWRDIETGRSRCVGFILYKEQKDATNAFEDMNGINIERRKVTIRYAKMPRSRLKHTKPANGGSTNSNPLTPEFIGSKKNKNRGKSMKKRASSMASASSILSRKFGSSSGPGPSRRSRTRRTSSPLSTRPSLPSPLYPMFVGMDNSTIGDVSMDDIPMSRKMKKKAISLDRNFIGPYSHHRKEFRRDMSSSSTASNINNNNNGIRHVSNSPSYNSYMGRKTVSLKRRRSKGYHNILSDFRNIHNNFQSDKKEKPKIRNSSNDNHLMMGPGPIRTTNNNNNIVSSLSSPNNNNNNNIQKKSIDGESKSIFGKKRSQSIFTPLRPSFFGGGPSTKNRGGSKQRPKSGSSSPNKSDIPSTTTTSSTDAQISDNKTDIDESIRRKMVKGGGIIHHHHPHHPINRGKSNSAKRSRRSSGSGKRKKKKSSSWNSGLSSLKEDKKKRSTPRKNKKKRKNKSLKKKNKKKRKSEPLHPDFMVIESEEENPNISNFQQKQQTNKRKRRNFTEQELLEEEEEEEEEEGSHENIHLVLGRRRGRIVIDRK